MFEEPRAKWTTVFRPRVHGQLNRICWFYIPHWDRIDLACTCQNVWIHSRWPWSPNLIITGSSTFSAHLLSDTAETHQMSISLNSPLNFLAVRRWVATTGFNRGAIPVSAFEGCSFRHNKLSASGSFCSDVKRFAHKSDDTLCPVARKLSSLMLTELWRPLEGQIPKATKFNFQSGLHQADLNRNFPCVFPVFFFQSLPWSVFLFIVDIFFYLFVKFRKF